MFFFFISRCETRSKRYKSWCVRHKVIRTYRRHQVAEVITVWQDVRLIHRTHYFGIRRKKCSRHRLRRIGRSIYSRSGYVRILITYSRSSVSIRTVFRYHNHRRLHPRHLPRRHHRMSRSHQSRWERHLNHRFNLIPTHQVHKPFIFVSILS